MQCSGQVPAGVPAFNVDIIHPCTEKHLKKYTAAKSVFLRETALDYTEIVEPYIKSIPKESISWVYNILEKVRSNTFARELRAFGYVNT